MQTIDMPAVHRFATDLENQRARMTTDPTMVYSHLEDQIDYYATICSQMRHYLNRWAREIFKGMVVLVSTDCEAVDPLHPSEGMVYHFDCSDGEGRQHFTVHYKYTQGEAALYIFNVGYSHLV